jgi:Ca2+-binding RTX toxin-like protein
MANITFNNQMTGFTMWRDEVMPQSSEVSLDYFTISTPNQNIIIFEGERFGYDGNSVPSGGDVERIKILFPGNYSSQTPDILIADLHVDASAYAPLFSNQTAAEKTAAFWTATLSGNDTINFGIDATQNGRSFNFAGDGYYAPNGAVGGNDQLHGDIGAGAAVGDFLGVNANYSAFGGNDDIRLDDSSDGTAIGDFIAGATASKLFAGDDFIQLGNKGGIAIGDVKYLEGMLDAGNDTILGGSGADSLIGDVVYAYDVTALNPGDDEIHGGGGADIIYGEALYTSNPLHVGGNDRLYGDAGTDSVAGGAGDDYLDGGADNDALSGNIGNDILRGGAGQDNLFGGSGADTADYRDKSQKVEVMLDTTSGGTVKVGGVAEDTLYDIENLLGGKAGDKLVGNATQGDNVFDGRGGNDTLNGAVGKDMLIGGTGKDKLTGGADADQFVFNAKLGSANIDKIVDFVHGVDEIALDDAIFRALGTSFEKNEFVARADGHTATKTSQHIIYDKSEGSLWYDVDGKGGKAAVKFAQLGSEASHPTDINWHDFDIV